MMHKYQPYDFTQSLERIDQILDAEDVSFEEIGVIPDAGGLTYTNGYYVNCSALFIDMRDSSKLPSLYARPTLAKIYRAYISECVAILNSVASCAEVNIVGDSVSAIFGTRLQKDFTDVFSAACQLVSLTDILNCKLRKRQINRICTGIGISYGRALMVKAGYAGSGINDVVWTGDVVNQAASLCDKASSCITEEAIFLSQTFYDKLPRDDQKILKRSIWTDSPAHGRPVNDLMDDWVKANCPRRRRGGLLY